MKKFVNSVAILFTLLFVSSPAFAQGTAETGSKNWIAIATALTIALAVVGGAFAQGRAASSALEGIARNPEASNKILTPMIIALALIETLVIYALVIALILSGKL